jgi:hypothetical protein
MTSEAVGGVGNRRVRFGKFAGRLFEGEDSGQMDVSAGKIFVQGAYTFGDDELGWSTYTVTVLGHTPMMVYKRAWTFNDATSSIWFRHDGAITCLAGVDSSGADGRQHRHLGDRVGAGNVRRRRAHRRWPPGEDDAGRHAGLHRRPGRRTLTSG